MRVVVSPEGSGSTTGQVSERCWRTAAWASRKGRKTVRRDSGIRDMMGGRGWGGDRKMGRGQRVFFYMEVAEGNKVRGAARVV